MSAKNATRSRSTPMWCRSAVNLSFFLCFAAFRTWPSGLGHAYPTLCPVRALPSRVPLGPRPWLHRLRHRGRGFVRRLHGYYDGVRLLTLVHHRLRLLAFLIRTRTAQRHWPTVRAPSSRARSVRACQGLRPRRAGRALALTRPSVLPSATGRASAPGIRGFSRLNSLAYALPCQRFADTLASDCA